MVTFFFLWSGVSPAIPSKRHKVEGRPPGRLEYRSKIGVKLADSSKSGHQLQLHGRGHWTGQTKK